MRSRNVMTITAALAVAVAMAFAVFSSGCGQKDRTPGERIAKELGLSQEQKAKLKGLREEMKNLHMENVEKMKALMDKSRAELLKPKPDSVTLAAYAKESGDLRTAMAQKESEHLLKVKNVLTPDQFNKLMSKDFMFRKGPPRGGHREDHEKGRDEERDER